MVTEYESAKGNRIRLHCNNINNIQDIEKLERLKSKYENDGWKLEQSQVGLFSADFIYRK